MDVFVIKFRRYFPIYNSVSQVFGVREIEPMDKVKIASVRDLNFLWVHTAVPVS
jgi:hypothetical protein